jgi:hypothetical protein
MRKELLKVLEARVRLLKKIMDVIIKRGLVLDNVKKILRTANEIS